MSRWAERVIAVSAVAGLICGGASGQASAQDLLPTLGFPAPDTGAATQAAPASVRSAVTTTAAHPSPGLAGSAVAAPPAQSSAQIIGLVAPIALYPDPLLGQVLMASTYPREVAEAARWIRNPANRTLGSDALTAALKAKGWNPSVMALVPFPSLLATMAEKRDWTEQLGKAFFAHEGDVMAAAQHLRHLALATGNLKATPECHCVIQRTGELISIQPSESELVSIPIYDPAVAFGNWADAAHPPVAFPLPSGFALAAGVAVGFEPAVDVALFGALWGWDSVDWPNRRIVVDDARYKLLAPEHIGFADNVWVREPPPPKTARVAAVAPRASRHAKTKPVRHLAATPAPPAPPPYWWEPPYRSWGPPPGAIMPPPRYIARNWYNDYYFDPYR